MPLLELDGLEAGYGPVDVLRRVTLTVPAGEVLAVLGANGAGKSTLMRAVAGLIAARRGRVLLGGEDVTRLSAAARVKRGVALVPEGRLLFPTLSVRDHLWLGGSARGRRGREIRRLTDEVIGLFPVLGERLRAAAGVLSGGQQQMLAIARALMTEPRLLLLDEPSMGLAPRVRREIYDVLHRLVDGGGLTIVLVEQDAPLALRLARRVVLMQGGRLVDEGPPARFLGTQTLQHVYLGRTN